MYEPWRDGTTVPSGHTAIVAYHCRNQPFEASHYTCAYNLLEEGDSYWINAQWGSSVDGDTLPDGRYLYLSNEQGEGWRAYEHCSDDPQGGEDCQTEIWGAWLSVE